MYSLKYQRNTYGVTWWKYSSWQIYSLKYFHILLFIYSYVSIKCITKCIFQRRRCCAFDSPELPNDSVGYPGLTYGVWGTTPSVLRFLSVIRHESPRYNYAFTEKAQHRWRWISLRTLTRGRLVPRQPRAIKRTTRTELRGERICNVERFLWNISATPTALHRCNIRNGGCIHGNAGATPTASINRNIRNNGHIH